MAESAAGADIGEFCRRVEEHLARVNDGHLIRIVGPAFELVRGWALEGVPLSIVLHGISMKAERHRAGRSNRPLRLEFCEIDVREVFNGWRRAVGVSGVPAPDASAVLEAKERKPPSLTKHLDRAIDRLARAAGQLDRSETYRDAVGRTLDALSVLREEAKAVRGAAREPLLARLPEVDAALMQAARSELGDAGLARLTAEATSELATYHGRLAADAWARSVELSVDRLLRDELGLPTLT